MLRSSLIGTFALLATACLVGCDTETDGGEVDDLSEMVAGPALRGVQPVPPRCFATVTPGDGAERVDVVARPTIQWSSPVGRSSASGRVWLLDRTTGAEVPTTKSWVDNRTLRLNPVGSLWFFKTYEVRVDSGVSAAGDVPCRSVSTTFDTRSLVEASGELRPAGITASASIGAHLFGVGRGHRNLQVWDLSGTPELVAEAPVATDPTAISAAGDRLYVAAGAGGLVVLDAQDPLAPAVLGAFDTPGTALDVTAWTASGRIYAAVADLDGVRILDVTDASAIAEVDAIGVGDALPSTSLAHEGNLLAVGRSSGAFRLVDVGTPDAVASLSEVEFVGLPVRDVALSNGVLYVARSYYGLLSFDVSDPSNPASVGDVHAYDGRGCTDDCIDDLGGLTVDGDVLFAATGRRGALRVALDGAGGMVDQGVLDVVGPGWSTHVLGSRLIVGGEAGPTVFDRAAPGGAPPLWFDPDGHGSARGVLVSGGALQVAANSRGLQTYELDSPLAPSLVQRADTAGIELDLGPMFLAASGSTLLLADGRSGLRLFDATDAEAPSPQSFVQANDRIAGVRVEGSIAVACDDNSGVLVVGMSDPGQPIVLARLFFPDADQCRDIEIVGGVAWIAASNSLRVLDLADPANPAWVGSVPLQPGEGLGSLTRAGGALFATSIVLPAGTRHLLTFDVANPAQPEQRFRSRSLPGASGLFATGDVLFVGRGTSGLSVYDVGDPYAPALQGTAAVTGSAGAIAYGGQTLYVAESLAGVRAFDVGVLP